MGHQVIKQPDGKLAVFSSVSDEWVMWDADRVEVESFFVSIAVEETLRNAHRVMDAVEADEPEKIYRQFTKTFEQANKTHLKMGHDPIDFDVT